MVLVADDTAHTVSLFTVIDEIEPQEILGSAIHLGDAGMNGPPIYDLGPGINWQPFGPGGSALARIEAPFPAGFMAALLGGHTYINIKTNHYPGGEIRGQIDEAASVGVESPINPVPVDPSFSAPNPFRGDTQIRFALPESSPVTLRVFDVSGREVRTLLDSAVLHGPTHQIEWDGVDNEGKPAPVGVYFYRLEISARVETGRMVLLR